MSSDFYVEFGARIRARRSDLELTQAQLGARLGVDRTTISSIETGRHGIPLHTLPDLADALGCAPADLLSSRTDAMTRSSDDPFVSRIRDIAQGNDDES